MVGLKKKKSCSTNRIFKDDRPELKTDRESRSLVESANMIQQYETKQNHSTVMCVKYIGVNFSFRLKC